MPTSFFNARQQQKMQISGTNFFNFMKTISLSNNPEIYLLESPVTIDC